MIFSHYGLDLTDKMANRAATLTKIIPLAPAPAKFIPQGSGVTQLPIVTQQPFVDDQFGPVGPIGPTSQLEARYAEPSFLQKMKPYLPLIGVGVAGLGVITVILLRR